MIFRNFRLFFVLFILLFLSGFASAQIFEAEDAILTNGAEVVADTAASGGFYVAQKDGNVAFNITLDEEAYYSIYVHASSPSGKKTNIFSIDGDNVEFTLEQNSSFVSKEVVSVFKLIDGEHQIKIFKSWGWINIDYIELKIVDASERFNINKVPVTPDPTDHAAKLYKFLYDNYGRKIISGAMTLNSMDEINWLKLNTGKQPALIGLDFMHCGRGYSWYNDEQPIIDAKNYYAKNGIPAFTWHWRDPSRKTEAFYTKDTDFDISKINDESSPEYKAIIQDIDYISGLLKKLQDEGVPALFRPLHEASGGWFWWGAKGPEPCKKLYRLIYDRMVNHNGLKNLIWVWTSQQNDTIWYPGDDVVDILGRDIYKDGDHSSQKLEFNQLNKDVNGKKMITLSECGSFPDPDELVQDEVPWSYFMPWYGNFIRDSKYNSLDLWKKAFDHDYVITLDEMPDLKSYTTTDYKWRSQLYPEDWKPGFKDSKDRFLHDFSYAGYHQGEVEIPFIQDNIVDITKAPYNADNSGETDVTEVIQQALNDVGLSGGGVVFLPPGIYRVNPGNNETALRIQYKNTVFRGSGTDSTFILNTNPFMREKSIIWMMGDWCTWSEAYGNTSQITLDLLYPTRVIPVKSVDGFKAGDKIIIRNDGTKEFIAEHGMDGIWTDWSSRVMFFRKIDSVDTENNLIYIDSPTRYYLKVRDNARIYHAKEHISECGIENLSIGNVQNDKSDWDEESYTTEGTGAYDVHASHAIYIKYAENCWVKNVNTFHPSGNTLDVHLLSNGLLIEQSRNVTIDSCFFQKPQYEGGGGNGYMFTLQSNDCLIENCRANDSRHNYDFKFPYSNGNVIYNCIGENSKYSSDFHMYLSMANLIDNFTVDGDYLESTFRPYGGNVIHGYSSTQSVFYNTRGESYHSGKDYIIESRQFKNGYVIGTSGPAYKIKLDPAEGSINGYSYDTSPRDFSEGIGDGEGLIPESLYLDQLKRRLEDSTKLASYHVLINIIDSVSGIPVKNCAIRVFNQEGQTNEKGIVSFNHLSSLLVINAEKANYSSIKNKQLTIYSDTTFTFLLTPEKKHITISVGDDNNGTLFWGAKITFGDQIYVTNEEGEVNFDAFEGDYQLLIEKNSYENIFLTINIDSDSIFHFSLIRSSGSIKFKLTENEVTPLNKATIILNSDTLITNNLGIATFNNLAVDTKYEYLISKNGYDNIAGELYLTGDTTILISIKSSLSIDSEFSKNKQINIYPNPAYQKLYIYFPPNYLGCEATIFDVNGLLIKKVILSDIDTKTISLDHIPTGIYILQITKTGKPSFNYRFLKNK